MSEHKHGLAGTNQNVRPSRPSGEWDRGSGYEHFSESAPDLSYTARYQRYLDERPPYVEPRPPSRLFRFRRRLLQTWLTLRYGADYWWYEDWGR